MCARSVNTVRVNNIFDLATQKVLRNLNLYFVVDGEFRDAPGQECEWSVDTSSSQNVGYIGQTLQSRSTQDPWFDHCFGNYEC